MESDNSSSSYSPKMSGSGSTSNSYLSYSTLQYDSTGNDDDPSKIALKIEIEDFVFLKSSRFVTMRFDKQMKGTLIIVITRF